MQSKIQPTVPSPPHANTRKSGTSRKKFNLKKKVCEIIFLDSFYEHKTKTVAPFAQIIKTEVILHQDSRVAKTLRHNDLSYMANRHQMLISVKRSNKMLISVKRSNKKSFIIMSSLL